MVKKLSHFVFMMALLLAMIVVGGQAMAQQKDKVQEGQEPTKKVGIVAHRGFHKYDGSAENTISSMQNAVDHDFYGTEFDMQVTGDNEAIVFHDDFMEGLPVQKAPLNEIFEHPAAKLSNGEMIPTLKEFMEKYVEAVEQQLSRGTTTMLFFEIKTPHEEEKIELAASMAVKSVVMHHLEKNVCFISFSLPICQAVSAQMPDVPVAYLGGDVPPRELKEMGINAIDYHFKVLLEHPEWIKEAHLLGMKVIAWTVNDEKIAHQLKDMGVDLITTDLPLDMTEWLTAE